MVNYYSKYTQKRKKKNLLSKYILRLLLLLILVALGTAYLLYDIVNKPNVWTPNGRPIGINIPTGSNFKDLKSILYSEGLIIHRDNFEWWAKQKRLPELLKPGHYVINNGMNNNELIDMLRSGKQSPVKVTFNNVRDIYELAGKVGRQIEADSTSIVKLLTDSVYLAKMGLNKYTVATIFIPNTYQFYWNTTARVFVNRMHQEYQKFWNADRRKKAKAIGLTPQQVSILASIVGKETNKDEEKPKIASVYLNRLDLGWRLQADPTVIFAWGNYNIHRVLNYQKRIKSPYNTYRHRGLPPGPISIPSISSIHAVLNPDHTDYMYFCAKDDLSGYHVFSKNNIQHQLNAERYQRALDKMGIYN